MTYIKYGLFGIAGLAVVFAFMLILRHQDKNRIEELETAIQQYRTNYELAKDSLDQQKQAINDLQKSNKKLNDLIAIRDKRIQNMQQEEQRLLNTINTLGRENEEVMATLSATIPCELWKELFPKSTRCANKDTNTKRKSP